MVLTSAIGAQEAGDQNEVVKNEAFLKLSGGGANNAF